MKTYNNMWNKKNSIISEFPSTNNAKKGIDENV